MQVQCCEKKRESGGRGIVVKGEGVEHASCFWDGLATLPSRLGGEEDAASAERSSFAFSPPALTELRPSPSLSFNEAKLTPHAGSHEEERRLPEQFFTLACRIGSGLISIDCLPP